jgi:hypothetical protein
VIYDYRFLIFPCFLTEIFAPVGDCQKPIAPYHTINPERVTLHLMMVKIQRIPKLALWGLGIMFLVSGVSAFTVTGVTINPPGILEPGDAVNVSYTVYAASGTAFPSFDDLQFVSGLDDTAWEYSIVVNGVENARPVVGGRTVTISGFELAYRNQDEVIVKVSLRGQIPPTSAPGSTKNLVTIQELDSRGYAITSTIVNVGHLVGTPTPTPTPASGSIFVTSTPSGANIYLDNSYKGLTPLTIDAVPNGNHTIVLRLDGYEESSRTISINGNSPVITIALNPLPTSTPTETSTLQPTATGTIQPGQPVPVPSEGYGSLSITTSPPGATVYVDGEMKGVTPATIPGLAAGKHSILLNLTGYSPLNTTIAINAGKTAEYSTGLSASAKTPGFAVFGAALSLGILLTYRNIRK